MDRTNYEGSRYAVLSKNFPSLGLHFADILSIDNYYMDPEKKCPLMMKRGETLCAR